MLFINLLLNCDPGGARTLDPMIKSHLLYQLSYRVNRFFSLSDLGGVRTLDPMIKSHLLYQLSYQVNLLQSLFPAYGLCFSIAGAKIEV